MPLLVLPAMVGVLVDQAGMSDSIAGWSASLNFFGAAAIGLAMAFRMHHLSLRQVAVAGLVIAVVADLASAALVGSGTAFLAARLVAGVGLGAAYVCAASAFPRYEDYDRGYGLFVTLQFIVSGVGLYLVPVFSDELGARGLFVVFALLDLLALSFARGLPGKAGASGDAARKRTEMGILLTLAAIAGIAGFTLFEAANNAQFTYIERFGVAQGLDEHRIGIALLFASLIGIPGAFAIVLLGHRFGTLRPLIAGISLAIAGLLVLMAAPSYAGYVAGGCCLGFSWAFCLPYIQSLLADLDRRGSVIAAGTSLSTLGSAVGPGLAATAVAGGHYARVFMLAILIFVLALIGFVISARYRPVPGVAAAP